MIHSLGNDDMIISGYMIVMGTATINGVEAYLTSPTYDTSKTHCLSFEYEVLGGEIPGDPVASPSLAVYRRCQPNMLAGDKIWGVSHASSGVVETTILASERSVDCYIDFVGTLHDVETDKVALANVQFSEGLCDDRKSVVCQDGEFVCENGLTCGPASSRCDNTAKCKIDAQKLQCG